MTNPNDPMDSSGIFGWNWKEEHVQPTIEIPCFTITSPLFSAQLHEPHQMEQFFDEPSPPVQPDASGFREELLAYNFPITKIIEDNTIRDLGDHWNMSHWMTTFTEQKDTDADQDEEFFK